MQSDFSRATSGQQFTNPEPSAPSYIDKLEKRRMALLILIIAITTHLGAKSIGGGAFPVMSYLTPELFDFF